GATTVVVLGGGSWSNRVGSLALYQMAPETVFRVLEAARLYRLLGTPTIVLSGGAAEHSPAARPESEVMRDAIQGLGVPADRLVLESASRTTRMQAIAVRRLVGPRAREPIVLVTSPAHMRRSIGAFRAAGLEPIASVSAYKSDDTFVTLRW